VRLALGDGTQFGAHLHYVHEPIILGTSGAIDNARSLLEGDSFIVINGKLITDIDLQAAIEAHRKAGALATLVLRRNPRRERFSIVEVADGRVTRFAGMPVSRPEDTEADAPLMFTGIQVLDQRIFEYIPRGIFSDTVVNVYPQAIAKGEKILAHVAGGLWYELSTLQRYLDISLALLRQQAQNVYCGRNAAIDPSAQLEESILWDDVSIEAGARIRRAIVGDGVRVKAGEFIEDAVVVRGDLLAGKKAPAKALKGEIRGENFVVSLAQ
jgi:NDP-sugar pyrophosphorylase family protein